MEHKTNLYAQRYFGHFLTGLSVFFVASFIYMRSFLLAIIVMAIAVLALIRLRYRKMSFDDDVFRYDGWLSSVEIPYSEILKVESSGKVGYPKDRVHGPAEYRITTKTRKLWVSLLFFDAAASREFHERFIKRGKKQFQ